VRAAFAYAAATSEVEPWCSYVRVYMKRHPSQALLRTASVSDGRAPSSDGEWRAPRGVA
jgi:hypothetical protein